MYAVAWVGNGDLHFADTERREDAVTLVRVLNDAGYRAKYWQLSETEETVKEQYSGHLAYRD